MDPRFKTLPFLDEVEKSNVHAIIIDLCKLADEPVKVKVEPGFDDSAPRLPTLELLDDPETEATLEPPVKKVKKEKLENPEKNDNLDDLLGDVYVTKVEKPRPILQRIEDEVHRYTDLEPIPLMLDPLLWWKSHESMLPLLSRKARQLLCIPATSVPSERVFSTAGDMLSAQRSTLKSKHVDYLIFLKKNMKV